MKRRLFLLLSALCFGFLPVVNAETCTENCIAQIGETLYASINEAVNSVTENDAVTIEVLRDSTDESGIFLNPGSKNITIDFNGYTVTISKNAVGSTGTVNQALHLEKGNTVVLKNGTIILDDSNTYFKHMIQNYSNLTLENVTVDASKTQIIGLALTNNAGEVTIKGNTNIYASSKENAVAFDVYWWVNGGYKVGPKVTIDTTGTIVGNIEIANGGTDFVTGSVSELTIKNINHVGTLDVSDENAIILVNGGKFSDENVKNYIGELNKVTKEKDIFVVSDNKEIETTVEEGTVEFESEEAIDNSYQLVVEPTASEEANEASKAVTKKLTDANKIEKIKVINVYDIEVQDSLGETVTMEDGNFVISLPVSKEMQKFDMYKVAYIKDGKVEEVFAAKLVNGKVVFKTTHLSTYAVVGMNKVTNPDTADNIILYIALNLLSLLGLLAFAYNKKRFN